MKNGFVPQIGDVLIINGKKHVLFYIDKDVPAHENGENFFKVGYYFISPEAISQNNMIDINAIKTSMVIHKKRYEMFPIEYKTDEKYKINEIKMLKFEKI